MGINLNFNYSTLFSSLSASTSNTSGNTKPTINLSDYASIKNGSYYQLLKAYYKKNSANRSSPENASRNSDSTLTTVQADSNSLKNSSEKLTNTGTGSLFTKKQITTKNSDGSSSTTYDYDMDAIYKGIKSFVDDYNSMLDSGSNSSNKNVLGQTLNMTFTTKAYSRLLSAVGITVGSDNKLTLDKESLKTSKVSDIKSLFNGNSSYAYHILTKASRISYYADAANGTYNNKGSLTTLSPSGSRYNSYF